ncbi:LbtU family siderophore porin [Legionella sp. W05-934-2]|jgi:hypothetical protein|uniref:LbtU family siderophore porin n=1 Tax=Legionella sp. W05-934-2 TaxID=1198649 RepID=UPI003462DB75
MSFVVSSNAATVHQKIENLERQSEEIQSQIKALKKEVTHEVAHEQRHHSEKKAHRAVKRGPPFHFSAIEVHTLDGHPESMGFYPTALLADDHIITYIAGTPVVSSPYLGDRPAFDGSDYIVNISSINRDVRLMQQRRRLYDAYEKIGYPPPNRPIIALSGTTQPVAYATKPFVRGATGDINLGAAELDVAAAVNDKVEAFMSIAFDDSPPFISGPRVTNSRFFLNMGFVNIGDLDVTPWYFTAGQLFVPFGRYSSAMISSPLTMILARTKARPVILGYKTQHGEGLFGALYGFRGETTNGTSGVAGINLGTTFAEGNLHGEIGGGYISSIADSQGLQLTSLAPAPFFGGFSSMTNGSEMVNKVPGADIHANVSFDSYTLAAEWVTATSRFRTMDLSFNGRGAHPSAGQVEAGWTFMTLSKPASLNVGYQWSRQALALQIPKKRVIAAFNISIWKDTVESLEYRHDWDYRAGQMGNGIAPPGLVNTPVVGTGRGTDTVSAQIAVFF